MADTLTGRATPTVTTTGTTTRTYGGLSPIDCYDVNVSRPLVWVEGVITTAITTATATMPLVYAHALVTAGMSGNISASVAHFQMHIGGTAVGKLSGIASYIQIDTGFVAHTVSINSSDTSITPLHVGVRSQSGDTHTLSTANVVFGIYAQYLQSGTGDPGALYFARMNSTKAITGIFYADNTAAAGYALTNRTTQSGSIPLIWVNGAGVSEVFYVNLYVA